jgi:2-methylcitrate dehydratase PrpD
VTPVTVHAQITLKASMSLHPRGRHRLEEIERAVIETRQARLRIIDKTVRALLDRASKASRVRLIGLLST